MKRLTATGLLAAALLTTTAAQAEDFTYSSHLPPSVAVNDAGVIPMFERVNEETGGGLNVKYFWAARIARPSIQATMPCSWAPMRPRRPS